MGKGKAPLPNEYYKIGVVGYEITTEKRKSGYELTSKRKLAPPVESVYGVPRKSNPERFHDYGARQK